ISYTSIDRRWEQWGWSVSWTRSAAQQFSTLDHANAVGFTLTGNGRASLRTPAYYRPRETLSVIVSGGGVARVRSLRADGAGRLHITLLLPDGAQPVADTVHITRGARREG